MAPPVQSLKHSFAVRLFNLFHDLFTPRVDGAVAIKLAAELLGVKISFPSIKKELEEHPDYPSLCSISDTLRKYGIHNIAIKPDADQLSNISTPFISWMRGENGGDNFFTIVNTTTPDFISFYEQGNSQWRSLETEKFLKRWLGVVLLMEPGEENGERTFDAKRKAERKSLAETFMLSFAIPLITLSSGLLTFFSYGKVALVPIIFWVFVLAGNVTTILLLWHELDQHNPVLRQICRAGKKINCGAILNSGVSKVFGLRWSILGFSYFNGILLLMLFLDINNPAVLIVLFWLSAVAATFILFSIGYQAFVAKQWCLLCVVVQILLAAQLAAAILGGWYNIDAAIRFQFLLKVLSAFCIPFVIVTFLFSMLKKIKEGREIKNEFARLKRNSQLFETLLFQQKSINAIPNNAGIILGNPEAKFKIIKICNPFCGPCAKTHKSLEFLLNNNPDLQVQILFNVTNSPGDPRTPVVKHFLAIAKTYDQTLLKRVIDAWYSSHSKQYETFAFKYPASQGSTEIEVEIKEMASLCEVIGVDFTPAFFISLPHHDSNKFYELPAAYSVSDLQYLMNG